MKKILMTLTLALGAAIAIPSVANAQNTTTTQQTKECCKEKKTCDKAADGKACCKEEGKKCDKAEGKACCKDAKSAPRKMKDGKFAKGDRKMKGPKDARMGKGMRKGGENPLMKGITLTDDQQAKMKALRQKNAADIKQQKADAKAKSKDEMQKIRADFDKEVEKILDKDQLKQYKANKAEMEANRAAKAEKKNK